MNCVRCAAEVEAADIGVRIICEDCAEAICKLNGWDRVDVGGMIELEATYAIEVEDLTIGEGPELEDGGGGFGEPEGSSGAE